jgi:PAS domain S-box-containing protein
MTELEAAGVTHRLAELERRFAERTAELEGERARLLVIVDHMLGGVVICDAGSGRISFANKQAERLLGPGAAEGESMRGWERFAAYSEDGTAYDRDTWPLARAIKRGENVRGELIRIERPDGSSLFLESSAAPIRGRGGAIVAGVLIVNDVTERQERNRADREFITNAAHEFRTPLASITSAIEVLQAGAKDRVEDRDRFLDHIENAAERLVRLTHALLVLARAQIDVQDPKVELVEVESLLRSAAEMVQPARGVEIHVECSPNLAAIVNRDLIEQAVGAVAENAARYTRKGRIALTAESPREGEIEIAVTDTGEGFDPALRDRLFDRFYRGMNRDGKGFGLGLAIARESVEAVGGSLDVNSEQGRGTVARITLRGAKLVKP